MRAGRTRGKRLPVRVPVAGAVVELVVAIDLGAVVMVLAHHLVLVLGRAAVPATWQRPPASVSGCKRFKLTPLDGVSCSIFRVIFQAITK